MKTSVATWIAATRPRFLTITAVAVGVGWATAASSGCVLDWTAALLTLAAALCVHAGANAVNDYHDRDADADNPGRLSPFTGGSRMIQEGRITARGIAVFGYALIGASVAIGLALVAVGHERLLWIGAAGVVTAIAYSAPPLRLSARGCGEVAVAWAWLLIVVGADLVQRGGWAARPFVAAVPIALLVTAILWVNEYPDHAADARAGKRTLVVRWGPRAASQAHLALVLVAYLWLLAACAVDALPGSSAWGLTAFPLSIFAALGLCRRSSETDTRQLLPVIKATILAAHVHGIALAIGLALA